MCMAIKSFNFNAREQKKMTKKGSDMPAEVRSPCIRKCSLNENRICPSCFRSIDEIVSWRDADDAEKRKVLEAAKRRRTQAKE